jgi:two-component system heavy metal sensor histidine kinase CusS
MKSGQGSRVRGSLALRIGWASVLFGLVVAAGTVAVGMWNLSHRLEERAAHEMQGRRELLLHILSTTPSLAAMDASRARFADLFFGHQDLHLALLMPQTRHVVAAFSEVALQSVTALGHAGAAPNGMHAWTTPGGAKFSGWHGEGRLADGSGVEFYLSVDRRADTQLLAGFVEATLLALPLLLALVALGAWLIAKAGLAPVRRLNRLAASIGTKSLHKRVNPAGLPSELADMAAEFNGMLARIDDGYRKLEEFSGDLAHEMRTPVATLLGRTQVALSRSRTVDELREVMEGNVEELERLAALISDMLFIARADSGASPIQTEAVELVAQAQGVLDYLSLVADEKRLQLRVQGQAPALVADRLLIQRAITNLLSNAVRHACEGSTITVDIAASGGMVTLAVSNEGEGIAPAHLERVFERFFRADPGRSREAGGSGLGLAIVRSIATAHQGSVSVRSAGGRTTFTLSLPLQPSPATASLEGTGPAPGAGR